MAGDAPDPLTAPGVRRLRSRASTAQVARHLAADGWAVALVDLSAAGDKAAIMAAFATGLGFPAWVGRNWDALSDALRDLSWWPAGPRGRAMMVRGADRLGTGTPRDRELLRDVLEHAAGRWAATPTPLVVLLRR